MSRHLPNPMSMEQMRAAILERVDVDQNGCWLWRGAKQQGYGVFRWFGYRLRPQRAHRGAWEAWKGEIPADMLVLHRCDVPACCNPEHLFLGTPADNMADMMAKGRDRHTPRLGSTNPNAIINEDIARAIFCASGRNVDIAKKFGVRESIVSDIRRRARWVHATASLDHTARA